MSIVKVILIRYRQPLRGVTQLIQTGSNLPVRRKNGAAPHISLGSAHRPQRKEASDGGMGLVARKG